MSIDNVIDKINSAAEQKKSFLFALDYELDDGFFVEDPICQQDVLWRVGEITNANQQSPKIENPFFRSIPVGYDVYKKKFDFVMSQLREGNSFLANLTIKTPIETNFSLRDIYHLSNSKYALLLSDRLVCFSPETFVKIRNGRIFSFPMKGTIDGDMEGAEELILNDYKESAEHFTIVDFIRSDLSRVSRDVRVDRLRYIDRLNTSNGDVLQVSSIISGELPTKYKLGDLLLKLLPAGSISGAPKPSTLAILKCAEGETRGYYTGIFGYYDGTELDSAVMIRYIENCNGKLYFRSGGGITINSRCEDEYQEVLNKIYLPFV